MDDECGHKFEKPVHVRTVWFSFALANASVEIVSLIRIGRTAYSTLNHVALSFSYTELFMCL